MIGYLLEVTRGLRKNFRTVRTGVVPERYEQLTLVRESAPDTRLEGTDDRE